MQKLFFDSSTNSCFFPLKKYLIFVNHSNITLSLNLSEETNEPEISYCLLWKHFSYSSPSHLTPETFVSPSALCLSFVFSAFVLWLIETTIATLQGLIHSNPSKSTNQVTLSNEHRIISFGPKVTWFTFALILILRGLCFVDQKKDARV